MAPATQALIKYEGSHLNAAELAVVKAWKRLDNPNQSRVARALKLHRATVSHHLTKSNVADAITRAEQREADKTHGQLGKVLKQADRIIGLLGKLTDDQITERPETALGSAKAILEVAEKLNALQEASSLFGTHADQERYKARAGRLVRRGMWLGSGRRLLGWAIPQDVVVKP